MELVEIGYIKSAHGIKGAAKMVLTAMLGNTAWKPEFLHLGTEQRQMPKFISEISGKDENWIVHFESISDRDQAQALKGQKIFVPVDQYELHFQESEENEWLDYQVESESGNSIGRIIDVIDNGTQLIWEVQKDEETFLIPAVEAYIVEVDDHSKTVIVNLPEGLLNL